MYKAVHNSGYFLPCVAVAVQSVGYAVDAVANTLDAVPTRLYGVKRRNRRFAPLLIGANHFLDVLALSVRYRIVGIVELLLQFPDFIG